MDKKAEEILACEAERDRLTQHAEQLRAAMLDLDTQSDALRHLADLRTAVAGQLSGARDTGAAGSLRAAIGSVFEGVVVRPADDPITDIVGYEDSAKPVHEGPT